MTRSANEFPHHVAWARRLIADGLSGGDIAPMVAHMLADDFGFCLEVACEIANRITDKARMMGPLNDIRELRGDRT